MSTTSTLVVDNFQTPDDGNYVCQARDRMMTVNSSTLSLTGECGCELTVRIQGNKVIGQGCESATDCTGDSKVKKQGGPSTFLAEVWGHAPPENF